MNVLADFIDKFNPNLPQPAKKTATVREVQPQRFIYPTITIDDHKTTLNNYRAHVQKVNDAIENTNIEIRRYNRKVEQHTLLHPPEKLEAFISLFKIKNSKLRDEEYNKLAEEFNTTRGFYIAKRTLKTIKPVTLQVFEAIIHAYTVQLRRYVHLWEKTAKTTPTKLPKAEVHPVEISTQERGNGIQNLNLSPRTITRHRNRLKEIGILQDEEFRGSKRPNLYRISPQILAISEGFLPKSATAENQPVRGQNLTNCQDIKVLQDPNRNKIEIKGIVNNSEERSSQAHNFNIIFYKTTNEQDGENKPPAAKKNAPAAEKFYTDHLNSLENRHELAKKIASGEYNNYIPLKMEVLNNWLSASYVSDEEFLRVCLQDFAKSAAALNKHNQAGAGSWYLALESIEKDFGCVNFSGKAMSKHTVLQKLIEFRYRLRWALGWFAKREWKNITYANLYFDHYRKLPSDICWQYTKKIWSKKMKQKTKAAALKKKKEADLSRRTESLSIDRKHRQKMDNAIYRYLRKEINFTELTAYIVRELPHEYRQKFGKRLDELNQRRMIN